MSKQNGDILSVPIKGLAATVMLVPAVIVAVSLTHTTRAV